MQLITDLEPYILWNNIVPINPLRDFDAIFNKFTNQVYPEILRDLRDGYKYFHSIKAQVLQNLGLYNDYELITLPEPDLPNFLQLYSLLAFNNPNYKLLIPTNVYAPFQGIYRAMLKSQSIIIDSQNIQGSTEQNNENRNNKKATTNLKLSPNITILPTYSYLSGIPLKESEVLHGIPTARIYDLSQVFFSMYIKGLESLSYTSSPNIFIVSARTLHIPLDTLFIFIKKNKDHKKLLDYIASKDNISAFDTIINNASWLSTWQQEQSSLLSTFVLYEFLKNISKKALNKALLNREKSLNKLYTELAEILGTNKKKYLLPTNKAYYNITLKLPIYMAQRIYRDLAQNYILVDYVQKSPKTAYLILTPGMELYQMHLQETLDLINKVI